MGYKDLNDDDKLEEAIKFVALGQPIPSALQEWLVEAGLFDVITRPSGADTDCQNTSAE